MSDAQIFSATLYFKEAGLRQSLDVSHLGGDLYRIEQPPVRVGLVNYYDVIEADRHDEHTLCFRRVVLQSNWRRFNFVLARSSRQSPRLAIVRNKVAEFGGFFGLVWGGLLIVCLPADAPYNPTAEIEALKEAPQTGL